MKILNKSRSSTVKLGSVTFGSLFRVLDDSKIYLLSSGYYSTQKSPRHINVQYANNGPLLCVDIGMGNVKGFETTTRVIPLLDAEVDLNED